MLMGLIPTWSVSLEGIRGFFILRISTCPPIYTMPTPQPWLQLRQESQWWWVFAVICSFFPSHFSPCLIFSLKWCSGKAWAIRSVGVSSHKYNKEGCNRVFLLFLFSPCPQHKPLKPKFLGTIFLGNKEIDWPDGCFLSTSFWDIIHFSFLSTLA